MDVLYIPQLDEIGTGGGGDSGGEGGGGSGGTVARYRILKPRTAGRSGSSFRRRRKARRGTSS